MRMAASPLEYVDVSTDAQVMADILDRDGALVVENALDARQLNSINQEVDGVIGTTDPGLRHPTDDFFVEFYGSQTIRLDGLPSKSKTFWEIMEDSFITRVADILLLPNCEDYLLNTGQLIQIGPGETAQLLHRDEDAWRYFTSPAKPLLEVEAMFALTDFTIENGCTQVVPGSHLWDPEREAQPHEVQRAEMKAGSALLYLGTAIHGGGANTSTDQWRRGMFFGFVLGWLRTEEACLLTVPREEVKKMPRRVQELIGYKAHDGIGVVDVGSPMVLLKD
ncbi:MAG: mitomycin antibiotic biosynthesis protein [Rhodospirillaceae bacterium]|nr:mitomycin antibiotic biosynthesis protein [Rhodospirillaceae bacterium]